MRTRVSTVRSAEKWKVAGSEEGREERGGAEGQEHSRAYNAWEVMWSISGVKIEECEEHEEEREEREEEREEREEECEEREEEREEREEERKECGGGGVSTVRSARSGRWQRST